MKTLIIYMSSHGTTEHVVNRLSPLLGYNTSTLINLKNQSAPSLDTFDSVIVGGSIHAGIIQKEIRRYCEANLQILLTKRLGLFMCYMDKENEIKEFQDSFPDPLIDHAQAKGFFGGEFLFDKMNFIERIVARRISGKKRNISRINSQAINHFAIQMAG